MDKVSIVYPYLHELSQGLELRQSFRSMHKHLKFPFEVILVGDAPEWYTGKHIKTEPVRGKTFARAFDIARKLDLICNSPIVSEDFIYCYDDQYALSDIDLSYFDNVVALEPYIGRPVKNASGKWNRLLEQTFNVLGAPEREVWNFETHLPRKFNKGNLWQLHRDYDLHRNPLLFSTLYYNEYFDRPDVVLVEKNDIKAGVYSKLSYPQIEQLCNGKLWLNNGEAGWSPSLDRFIKNAYPQKCINEK